MEGAETERQDRESNSPATSSVTIIGDWTVGGLCVCVILIYYYNIHAILYDIINSLYPHQLRK